MRPSRSLVVVATLTLSACAVDGRGPLLEPGLGEGRADVVDRVESRSALGLGEEGAVRAEITEDLELHGYTLAVRPGAVVTLDISRTGTSRALDSTLFVFGPRSASGGYGSAAIAFDDDSGWGRQSRIRGLALADGGTYLVVVGTHDGRGRGRYRLVATCGSGDCAPVEAGERCHPAIAAAVESCVEASLADPDLDPRSVSLVDLVEACADAERVAPARDALCAGPEAPAALCELDSEAFATTHLPLCRLEVTNRTLDRACVFGEQYGDLFDRAAEAVVLVSGRILTAASRLTELERAQIVAAVGATAHDDVTTAEEAFAVVDGNEVSQHELWDASGRRAFTVYELGAGDNSFGMFFAQGTAERVATINDGDLVDCRVSWGPERRRCAADTDCAEGLRCTGVVGEAARGRCIDRSRDDHPAMGSECVDEAGCPPGSGLVCAGAPMGGGGLCLPGWMRGRFVNETTLAIPDGDSAGLEAQLLVYGLATVDVDVTIDLMIFHPGIGDLRVTLTNPDGTEVTVFDGSRDGPELVLRDAPVPGFSGDERVNGIWRLRVVDGRAGRTGALVRFGLTVTSRWD